MHHYTKYTLAVPMLPAHTKPSSILIPFVPPDQTIHKTWCDTNATTSEAHIPKLPLASCLSRSNQPANVRLTCKSHVAVIKDK